jgi:hypothetical protein
MQILEHLGLALGLASLSGLNLYLTTFIAGVLVHFNLLHLGDKYQELAVLGHPWIIGVAGVLYLVEFFADKVPWLDSAWDAVHTFIRPVGGTLLAMTALGDMPPHVQVIAGLLAGGAALTTHGAKAGTRLIANHSPEPFSNVALSLGEDAVVVGGSALAFLLPAAALVVFTALLIVIWLVFPKVWRVLRKSWNLLRARLSGGRGPAVAR